MRSHSFWVLVFVSLADIWCANETVEEGQERLFVSRCWGNGQDVL